MYHHMVGLEKHLREFEITYCYYLISHLLLADHYAVSSPI